MTMVSAHGQLDPGTERRVNRYRRLLVLYPREFRSDFGDDLVQGYRDLLVFSTGRRGLWWRTTRDLITSAARERGESLRPGNRGDDRSGVIIAVIGALTIAGLVVVGGGFFLLPALILVGLPVFGLTRFVHAVNLRRATGGSIRRPVVQGIAAFVPAGVTMWSFGDDAGYFVFIGVATALIVTASFGILWAGFRLLRPVEGRRPWARLAVVLVPSIAILAFIIGASVNSYLDSQGPPGDHSVANASADSRALWQAAYDGNLTEVIRLTTETCCRPLGEVPDRQRSAQREGDGRDAGLDDRHRRTLGRDR